MEFGVWTKGLATLTVDCLVLGVFEDAQLGAQGGSVDAATGGRLRKLLTRGDFSGRPGETLLVADAPASRAVRSRSTGRRSRSSTITISGAPWRS